MIGTPRQFPLRLVFVVAAQAQDEAHKPIPLSAALKAGPEKLVGIIGDESEAGMDQAAVIYAAAKRVETESKLAARDVALVLILEEVRRSLAGWNEACSDAAYTLTGDGVLWIQRSVRAKAGIEDVLAQLAEKLPLEPVGEPVENKQWKKVKAMIASLMLSKDAVEADPKAARDWKKQKDDLEAAYEALGVVMMDMPPEQKDAVIKLAHGLLAEVNCKKQD